MKKTKFVEEQAYLSKPSTTGKEIWRDLQSGQPVKVLLTFISWSDFFISKNSYNYFFCCIRIHEILKILSIVNLLIMVYNSF